MASAAARKNFKAEADAERERRERERREFKEAQELEGLRRTFKRIDKKGDGKIDTQELIQELDFLGHKVSEKEAALTIWEVDDDNDGCVDWDEFRTMFYRVRDDTTGCEPRKLFNVVDFLMLDKNHSGAVDMDECVTLLWSRYGREVVEENLKAMKKENTFEMADAANEKNINFSFFSEIQRRCKKLRAGSGIKPGATTVPQVKGLAFISNPALQHLM
mmetsp:Transcript_22502/g.38473  ORF Transcript_22502/g.38473 Transcript_22502/m.38473 type:complete len:218 (+) Transcript_22502:51-704(+)